MALPVPLPLPISAGPFSHMPPQQCVAFAPAPQVLQRSAQPEPLPASLIDSDRELLEELHANMRAREASLPKHYMRSPCLYFRRNVLELVYNMCRCLKYSYETFFTAVAYYDHFSDSVDVPIDAQNLAGIACLLLAAKWEEKEEELPSLSTLVAMVNYEYSVRELQLMERVILDFKSWNMTTVVPLSYADMYLTSSLTATDAAEKPRMQQLLMRVLLILANDYTLISTPPSLLAATAVIVTRSLAHCETACPPSLLHMCGYTHAELRPLVERLYVLAGPKSAVPAHMSSAEYTAAAAAAAAATAAAAAAASGLYVRHHQVHVAPVAHHPHHYAPVHAVSSAAPVYLPHPAAAAAAAAGWNMMV